MVKPATSLAAGFWFSWEAMQKGSKGHDAGEQRK
jgi:hypothetical protein